MSLQLTVPDMACAACSETITKALKTLDPTAQVTADSQTKLVTIETQQPEIAVKQAIVAAGYSVASVQS